MKKSIILTALVIAGYGALQGSPIKNVEGHFVFILNAAKEPLTMRTFSLDRAQFHPARTVTSMQLYVEDMGGQAYVIESPHERIGIAFDKDKWVYYELPKTKAIGSLTYDDMKIKNKKSTEKSVKITKGANSGDFLVASLADNKLSIKLASVDELSKMKNMKMTPKSMNMSAEMKAQGVDFS
jgi:hypothetical protein